jgi:autotransporter-associated beta strand protein
VVASVFFGTDTLVKQGGGTLVLDKANTHTGGTLVEAGDLIITHTGALAAGSVAVRAGAKLTLDVGAGSVGLGQLGLAAGGLIDVGYGRLTLTPRSYSLPAVLGLLQTGYVANWTGTSGLTSRAAGTVAGGGLGYVINDDGSLTFGFAASGDSNLDDVVDILDLSAMLASGKFDSGESASWSEGDYNYDQVLDILDISDFLNTSLFNAGTYIPSQSQPQSVSSSLSAVDSAFLALVAESTTSGSTPAKKRRFATS